MNESSIAFYVPSLCGRGAEWVMVRRANGFPDRAVEVDLVPFGLARAARAQSLGAEQAVTQYLRIKTQYAIDINNG